MKRFFLALLLLALPLAAQEEKKAEAKPAATVQKLFVLKYADPQSVRMLLSVFHANMEPNRDMRVWQSMPFPKPWRRSKTPSSVSMCPRPLP